MAPQAHRLAAGRNGQGHTAVEHGRLEAAGQHGLALRQQRQCMGCANVNVQLHSSFMASHACATTEPPKSQASYQQTG